MKEYVRKQLENGTPAAQILHNIHTITDSMGILDDVCINKKSKNRPYERSLRRIKSSIEPLIPILVRGST